MVIERIHFTEEKEPTFSNDLAEREKILYKLKIESITKLQKEMQRIL